jgi:hypothetical protein
MKHLTPKQVAIIVHRVAREYKHTVVRADWFPENRGVRAIFNSVEPYEPFADFFVLNGDDMQFIDPAFAVAVRKALRGKRAVVGLCDDANPRDGLSITVYGLPLRPK